MAWRGVAWRGVAWRGVAWRGVAWREQMTTRFIAVTQALIGLNRQGRVALATLPY
ncbi:hypothetical protein [Erwinia sp. HR93]|uniref:hypothetical protein n=1 Tax=Erwinia sp. HR93 TaxID=3094840 RepID=UPI002ADEAB18|nr:hypothetical protein [Erwinia sp. HR93]MEA1063884.1 hypothetical protein [Erwinia sp. HR93]